MTIEPIDTFRTVHIHLKNDNLNEWNNFILDTEDMQQLINFMEKQLNKSKTKKNWNKQRFNRV